MSRILFFIIACAAPFGPAHAWDPAAAQSPTALLSEFEGDWASSGDAFGAPATSVMRWSPALDGKFMRLDYRIEMSRGETVSVFEGVAHYRLGEGDAVRGYWADNSGDLHPISAVRDGDALMSTWGVEGAKLGRTRYERLADGAIEVTDWIMTPDGWRQFNRNTFGKRAQP